MYLSSYYEFSTTKPGNVGPNQDVDGITIQNYELVSEKIKDFTHKYFSSLDDEKNTKKKYSMGEYIFQAVTAMIECPPFENVIPASL